MVMGVGVFLGHRLVFLHLGLGRFLAFGEEVRFDFGHIVLVPDDPVFVGFLSSGVCESEFAEDPVFLPLEAVVQISHFLHFLQQRHLVHQVGLQEVGVVVCLVEGLVYGKAEELAQIFKSVDFPFLLPSVVNHFVDFVDDVLDFCHDHPFAVDSELPHLSFPFKADVQLFGALCPSFEDFPVIFFVAQDAGAPLPQAVLTFLVDSQQELLDFSCELMFFLEHGVELVLVGHDAWLVAYGETMMMLLFEEGFRESGDVGQGLKIRAVLLPGGEIWMEGTLTRHVGITLLLGVGIVGIDERDDLLFFVEVAVPETVEILIRIGLLDDLVSYRLDLGEDEAAVAALQIRRILPVVELLHIDLPHIQMLVFHHVPPYALAVVQMLKRILQAEGHVGRLLMLDLLHNRAEVVSHDLPKFGRLNDVVLLLPYLQVVVHVFCKTALYGGVGLEDDVSESLHYEVVQLVVFEELLADGELVVVVEDQQLDLVQGHADPFVEVDFGEESQITVDFLHLYQSSL